MKTTTVMKIKDVLHSGYILTSYNRLQTFLCRVDLSGSQISYTRSPRFSKPNMTYILSKILREILFATNIIKVGKST